MNNNSGIIENQRGNYEFEDTDDLLKYLLEVYKLKDHE